MKAKSPIAVLSSIVLIVASLFILNQCVFKKNDTKKDSPDLVDNQQFEVKRQDAKLLVEITNVNMDVLIHCENIKNSKLNKELIIAAAKVEYNHLTINENLNQIAIEKLISLPDSIFNSFHANSITMIDDFNSDIYIKKMLKIIEREIRLFDNLEQNTDDTDMKVLAIQSKTKLKLSLLQLEYTRTNTNNKLQDHEKNENNFNNSISSVDYDF